MKRLTRLLLAAAAVITVLALPGQVAADAPPGPYFTGFETNTASWFDLMNGGDGSITRRGSGYTNSGGYADLIGSASGLWHARVSGDSPCAPPVPCFGAFTRWGGSSQSVPGGW